MHFLLFLLAAYGLCFGLMNEKVPFFPLLKRIPLFPDSEGNTFFARMFDCPYCTGFHTGWVIWLIKSLPDFLDGKFDPVSFVPELLFFGFASSAFCYIADTLVILIEKKTPQ